MGSAQDGRTQSEQKAPPEKECVPGKAACGSTMPGAAAPAGGGGGGGWGEAPLVEATAQARTLGACFPAECWRAGCWPPVSSVCSPARGVNACLLTSEAGCCVRRVTLAECSAAFLANRKYSVSTK